MTTDIRFEHKKKRYMTIQNSNNSMSTIENDNLFGKFTPPYEVEDEEAKSDQKRLCEILGKTPDLKNLPNYDTIEAPLITDTCTSKPKRESEINSTSAMKAYQSTTSSSTKSESHSRRSHDHHSSSASQHQKTSSSSSNSSANAKIMKPQATKNQAIAFQPTSNSQKLSLEEILKEMKPKPFIDRIPENLPSSSQHRNQQSNVKIASSCNTANSNNISVSGKRNTFESIHKNDLDLSEDEDESHEITKNNINIHNSKRDDVNKNIQPLIKNENEMSQQSQNNTHKNNPNNKNSNNSNSIIGMKSGDTKKLHDSTTSSSTQRQITSNQNEKTQKIDINSLSKNLHSKDASNISNDVIKADVLAFNINNKNNDNIKNSRSSNSSANYNNTNNNSNKNVKTVKVESGEINNEDEGSSSSESSSDEGSSSSDDEADSTSAESSGSSSAASSSSSSSASSSDNEDDKESHTSLKHTNKQLNTLQVDTVAAKLDKINEQKKTEKNFITSIDDEEESNEELGSYFNRNPAHDEEDDVMNSGMTLTTLIKNIEENSNISPSKLMGKHTVDDVSSTSVATRKPYDDEENTFTFKFEDDELDDDSQTSNHNQNCIVANEHSSSVSVASVASNTDKHAVNDAKRTDIGSEHVSSVSTSAPESECFDTNVKSNESMINSDCIDSDNVNNRPESTSNFATSEMNEIDEDKHASVEPLEHDNNASPVKRVITEENLADIDDNATYRDEESIKKCDINEPIKSPHRPKDEHDSIKRQIQLFSPPSPLHSQEHNDDDCRKDTMASESKANAVINLSFDNDDGELHESNAPKLVQFDGANLFKKMSKSFLSACDEATIEHSEKENSIVREITNLNELKRISVTVNECVDNSNSDSNGGQANQVPLSAGFLISNENPLSLLSNEVPSHTSNASTPSVAASHTTATTTKNRKEAPSSTPKQKNRDEKKDDEPRSEKKHSKDKSSKKISNLSLEESSSANQKADVTQKSSPSKLIESKTHAKTSDVIASATNSKKDLIEKIQYDENGRPKLIMSIELDLLNICSQYISNSETKSNIKDLDSSSPKLKSTEFSNKSSSKTSRSRDEINDDILNSSRSSSKSHKRSSTSKSRDGNERASKNDDRSSTSPSKRQKSSSASSKNSSSSSSKKESSHSSSSHSRSHHESHNHSHSHRHHGHHSHQHSSSNTSSSVLTASANESYSLKRMSSSDDLKKDTHKKPKYVDSTSPVKASKYEVTGYTNVSATVNSLGVEASKSSLLSQSDKLQQSVSLPSSVTSSQLVAGSADSSQNIISTLKSSQTSTSTSSKIMSSINNSSSSSSANPTAIVKPIHFNSESSKARQSKKPDDTRQKPKFDFLESQLPEETFHSRGTCKKHEGDMEKDMTKKVILYMEAVTNFCLCTIAQYRIKKLTKTAELLNQTWQLLKHINEKIMQNIKSEELTKKFSILAGWLEVFIFHWLWKFNINECKKLAGLHAEVNRSLNSNANTTPNALRTTSPNDVPPSPNNMIPASSQNGNVNNTETISSTKAPTSTLENELKIYRDFYTKSTMLIKYNDYNIRSQLRWDTNEMQINNDRQLKDFRNMIQTQLQENLYINCEVETFASYVFSGLELLQLQTLYRS